MDTKTTSPVRVYTIDALLAEGFPLTTIRYYQTIGLLPKAEGGRGRNACYTDIHIAILREIRRARDENRSLTDLKDWSDMKFPHKKRSRISAQITTNRRTKETS